jgi:hypothetical protein
MNISCRTTFLGDLPPLRASSTFIDDDGNMALPPSPCHRPVLSLSLGSLRCVLPQCHCLENAFCRVEQCPQIGPSSEFRETGRERERESLSFNISCSLVNEALNSSRIGSPSGKQNACAEPMPRSMQCNNTQQQCLASFV